MRQEESLCVKITRIGKVISEARCRRYVCERPREGGFTLIELLVVVAIMLVISAVAMPRIMNSMDDIRLRSASRDVIGLMQQARQAAIKQNAFYQMGLQAQTVYIDLDGDGTYNNNEPSVQLPYTMTITQAGAPAWNPQPLTALGPNFVPLPNTPPAFNARGLPCQLGGGNCVTKVGANNVAFLFYFSQTRTFGGVGWAAVTVNPAGRMRVWFYEPRPGIWSTT
jgi:prepilin-type N-terminal cleavage/methylation domain-containing protein